MPTHVPRDAAPVLALAVVKDLRASLDVLGDALASWRLDEMESAEATLAAVLRVLPQATPGPGGAADAALATAIAGAQGAVDRCRRLGASMDDLAWRGLRPDGDAYGPTGRRIGRGARHLLRAKA